MQTILVVPKMHVYTRRNLSLLSHPVMKFAERKGSSIIHLQGVIFIRKVYCTVLWMVFRFLRHPQGLKSAIYTKYTSLSSPKRHHLYNAANVSTSSINDWENTPKNSTLSSYTYKPAIFWPPSWPSRWEIGLVSISTTFLTCATMFLPTANGRGEIKKFLVFKEGVSYSFALL